MPEFEILAQNLISKLSVGAAVGASGLLLFRSPRLRTFWLGTSLGVAAGYGWHENTAALQANTVNFLEPFDWGRFMSNLGAKLPDIFRVK